MRVQLNWFGGRQVILAYSSVRVSYGINNQHFLSMIALHGLTSRNVEVLVHMVLGIASVVATGSRFIDSPELEQRQSIDLNNSIHENT